MSAERDRGGGRDGDGVHGTGARRPPPNAKPRPDLKDRPGGSSYEQQGKKEKTVIKARRSRSSDSERRGRGRRGERGGEARRSRGRSEDGRRRAAAARDGGGTERRHRDVPHKAPEDDVEDTECVVCFCSYDNVFKTPKLLACGHTFCLECLARINVTSAELKALSCPVCREITELPHGRDLPHLGNNQDVFRKLPPEMQRAQSVRFKRNKGKLMLKKTPSVSGGGRATPKLALPAKKKKQEGGHPAGGQELQLGTLEQGGVAPATIDVGRPPSRVRGRLRRLFHSDQCYYTVVASIIAITVSLMLVGILAFVVIPNVMIRPPGGAAGNGSQSLPAPGDPPRHLSAAGLDQGG